MFGIRSSCSFFVQEDFLQEEILLSVSGSSARHRQQNFFLNEKGARRANV